MLFHGGGWSVGSPEWTFTSARRYAEQGLVAVSVQYRLSNDTVTPVDALTDACGAFQWVRVEALKLGVDPHRMAASGVSAGGQLAQRLRRSVAVMKKVPMETGGPTPWSCGCRHWTSAQTGTFGGCCVAARRSRH